MRLSTETALAMIRRPSDNDTLGGRIWRARDAMNLSVKDLADRLGVRGDTISAWERDRSEPRTNRLFMLAGVLGVTPAWLIAGIGDAPKDDLSNTVIRPAARSTGAGEETARADRKGDLRP